MTAARKRAPSLPSKLYVGTYEFPLKVVPATAPELDDADGMCNTDEAARCIYISALLDTRKRLEIVYHEITHALNFVHDIDEDKVPIEEELISTKHGVAWSQFYLDNPRFVLWLVHTLARIRREQRLGEDEAIAVATPEIKGTDA